jgi:hypothetical protein
MSRGKENIMVLFFIFLLYLHRKTLSRVANAPRTSQGEIYILHRCFSCTVQKTGMEIVLEVFHPFAFYDVEHKLRFVASKSTVYLFREESLQIRMC